MSYRRAAANRRRARITAALLIVGVVAAPAVFSPRDALSAEYTLMPSPQTVHIGHFSAALKPVLTINSGDIVTIETATSLDPVEIDQSGAVPPSVVPEISVPFTARSRIAALRDTSLPGRSSLTAR